MAQSNIDREALSKLAVLESQMGIDPTNRDVDPEEQRQAQIERARAHMARYLKSDQPPNPVEDAMAAVVGRPASLSERADRWIKVAQADERDVEVMDRLTQLQLKLNPKNYYDRLQPWLDWREAQRKARLAEQAAALEARREADAAFAVPYALTGEAEAPEALQDAVEGAEAQHSATEPPETPQDAPEAVPEVMEPPEPPGPRRGRRGAPLVPPGRVAGVRRKL